MDELFCGTGVRRRGQLGIKAYHGCRGAGSHCRQVVQDRQAEPKGLGQRLVPKIATSARRLGRVTNLDCTNIWGN
jgi:hypothetical protein